MTKTFMKRVSAAFLGTLMAAGVLSAFPADLAARAAAGDNLPMTLAAPVKAAGAALDDPPTNEDDCTYLCKNAIDQYDTLKITDTPGYSPSDLYGSSISTLQFNFEAADPDAIVTNFSYYFGCSADKAHSYYVDLKDNECTPYAHEFSVVVKIPAGAVLTNADSKFQLQNCYTGMAYEADKSTKENTDIILKSIVANGTTDTSNGEAPDWIWTGDVEGGEENTGGLYYSSRTYDLDKDSPVITDNGDGTYTITTIRTVKINPDALKDHDGRDIVLTLGENYGEEYYLYDYVDETGTHPEELNNEDAIRQAGLPINSHKFGYNQFRIFENNTTATKVRPLALSVTVETNAAAKRFMYGGGLNVEKGSPADTENAKLIASTNPDGSLKPDGVTRNKYAGYWYNDIGGENLQACEAAGVEFGITPGGGTNIANQDLGSYFTVTWDVPEQVAPYTTMNSGNEISFQLWYGEALNEGETLETATIRDAALTYEEKVTFKNNLVASVTGSKTAKVGESVTYNYADFNLNYEHTADPYAYEFDIETPSDCAFVQFGFGTSVVSTKALDNKYPDHWFQSDDIFKNDNETESPVSAAALNLIPSDKEARMALAKQKDAEPAAYVEQTGKNKFHVTWLVPGAIAEAIGSSSATHNGISTEKEGDNFKLGVWYGGLGEKSIDSYTISNVKIHYAADDRDNGDKRRLFEDDLEIRDGDEVIWSTENNLDLPGELVLELGEERVLYVNVPDSTALNTNRLIAKGVLEGQDLTVTGVNVGESEITVSTPGEQQAVIHVTVVAPAVFDPTADALYGDVNLDKHVDILDAVLLNKAIADVVTLNEQQKENANCRYDDEINTTDAIDLLRFIVSAIKHIGPES